jgi:hypothetical protein
MTFKTMRAAIPAQNSSVSQRTDSTLSPPVWATSFTAPTAGRAKRFVTRQRVLRERARCGREEHPEITDLEPPSADLQNPTLRMTARGRWRITSMTQRQGAGA